MNGPRWNIAIDYSVPRDLSYLYVIWSQENDSVA